ncbi:MAG: class I SAM-dependent methyltransferase [Solirubrobacteraceae bacterium]
MNSVPTRYRQTPDELLERRVREVLRPGLAVLDVGSGRSPAVLADDRPQLAEYVGLDLSRAELDRAPARSYDAVVVGDAIERRPELEERFDLVVSRQVLEHVWPLDRALSNLHGYLRPGGALLASLSGRRSVNAALNRLLPAPVASFMLERLLGRDPETVFPAHYDRCDECSLRAFLASWSEAEVTPLYLGAAYFNFARPLRALYLRYEDWALRSRHDLATHYVVEARR